MIWTTSVHVRNNVTCFARQWAYRTLIVAILIVFALRPVSPSSGDASGMDQPRVPTETSKASTMRPMRAILLGYNASAHGKLLPYVAVRTIGDDPEIEPVYLSSDVVINGVPFTCSDQPAHICKHLPAWLEKQLPVMVQLNVWRDSFPRGWGWVVAANHITTRLAQCQKAAQGVPYHPECESFNPNVAIFTETWDYSPNGTAFVSPAVTAPPAPMPAPTQETWYVDRPRAPQDTSQAQIVRGVLIGYDANYYGHVLSPYIVVARLPDERVEKRMGWFENVDQIYLSENVTIDGVSFACEEPDHICKRLPAALLRKMPVYVELHTWDDNVTGVYHRIIASDVITTRSP